ncbi:MAG: endolytic transglycosylase MltG [Sphingomonadales bacterium]|nr:endolytic transglycosylase MltG [Sphingomonadales bacterium]
MARRGCLLPALAVLGLLVAGWSVVGGWVARGPLTHAEDVIVPERATLGTVAVELQRHGAIVSARGFRLRARLFHPGAVLKAGEFLLPPGASESRILAILSGDMAVRRFVTIPEGMPSVEVADRLRAQSMLTGPVAVPAEGSVLPQTYDYRRGDPRAALLARMQAGMSHALAELWAQRAPDLPVKTPEQALILASIVEKETAKPAERPMVAGLYENRLRRKIMLQADPTIIYPITRGRPLGRRIRQSEITAVNDYNTYAMTGLPRAPITNPSLSSIAAVLHPAETDALYMVADGSGGHVFAATLAEHNRNVARWFAIRRARGEL